MCDVNVYFREKDKDEIFLENVAMLKVQGDINQRHPWTEETYCCHS